jgi:hypothetical protein
MPPNSGEFGYGEFGYGEFGYGEFGYGSHDSQPGAIWAVVSSTPLIRRPGDL